MAIKIIIHNVVLNDDKILLLKRASTVSNLPNYWDIPGGSLEEGEDLAFGVVRETIEESGLVTSDPELFYYFANYEATKGLHYITIFFVSNYISNDVVLRPDEHQEFKWVSITDLTTFSKENDVPDYFDSLAKRIVGRFAQ